MPRHRFADTRDRIERAAVHLFVEKGVTETTIKDIARAVGLSEGALYRHFESKDELVWKAFERHYVDFGATLQALAESVPTARGKVAAMIRGFCRAHDDNRTLFNLLLCVEHGQLAKVEPGTPTPVDVMRSVLDTAMASRSRMSRRIWSRVCVDARSPFGPASVDVVWPRMAFDISRPSVSNSSA